MVLGSIGVDAFTTADVLGVLIPIWTAKYETARKVRMWWTWTLRRGRFRQTA